ncbi:MAG: hypothetical protein MUO21_06875 [Nitrososphaeraceae archaeon]|nr:hypothetical protein [Nitrososphaeraceae archaeon]
MKRDLFKNYDQIIQEISKGKTDRDLGIDIWDIISAVFMAAFITVGALGAGWIAYYIVITLSAGSAIGIGATCLEWLKVKENRSVATKYLQTFLNSNFAMEIKEISIESIKVIHCKIKSKLMKLFDGDIGNFEKVIIHTSKN